MEQNKTVAIQTRSAYQPNGAPHWTALLFAVTVLGIGMLPGALSFALDTTTSTRIGLGVVPIPVWVFRLVWLIAYPSMGIATWLVWRRRREVDVAVPLVVFGVALLQTLSFWLVDSIRMIAVIDATGVILAYTVAWVYARHVRAAVWWLLPWLIWMPITFVVKLWTLYATAP